MLPPTVAVVDGADKAVLSQRDVATDVGNGRAMVAVDNEGSRLL